MINGKDLYEVVKTLAPLYFAMILAYGSVRWWKIFTPEQCSGINNFVMKFAFPFLTFKFVYTNNPYKMNFHFIAADALQKVSILVLLFLFRTIFAKKKYGSASSLGWVITLFSLSSLPSTLVVGIPLLKAMYGDSSRNLMVQVVLLQAVVWFLLTLIMFEYRAAMIWISEQYPDTAGSIKSIRVDSDVVSIASSEPLEAETEVQDEGKLHVVVRRQFSDREASFGRVVSSSSSRPPDPAEVEISPVRSDSQRDQQNPIVKEPLEEQCLARKVESRPDEEVHKFGRSNSVCDVSNDSIRLKSCSFRDEAEPDGSNVIGSRKQQQQQKPPAHVVIRLVFIIVSRKLMRNPNCYGSILGLVWSLIAFRWNIKMPEIVSGSIEILSNCGLGMAMFSLGLFMALQPKLIPCGKKMLAFAMGARFLAGPAFMAVASAIIGIRGVIFQVAVVQAALPPNSAPFVFAKEYNVNLDILSTSVIFGTLLALPATIIYNILLGL